MLYGTVNIHSNDDLLDLRKLKRSACILDNKKENP
jgi:hypothetical protein